MEHPQFKTWFNYDHEETPKEVNKEKSLTIPDQSLSVKDILYRFAQGLPLDDIQRGGCIYDAVDDEDDFTVDPLNQVGLDITERMELRAAADNVIQQAKYLSEQHDVTTINDDATKGSEVNNRVNERSEPPGRALTE